MFYVPNLPYAFYLAARAKHSAFFSAANPCIKSSGNGTESKFDTIELVPKKFKPKTVFVKANSDFNCIIDKLKKKEITFPLIAKPDIGFRGLLVKKIASKEELKTYFDKYPIAIIIQEFLDYKNECGIFYHRNPNEKKGKITSITLKRFLTVTGNGTSTLKELISLDNRAQLYIELLEELHREKLLQTPLKGEVVKLSTIGNHSKGTQFMCGAHLNTKKLEETFDSLSDSIPGWFYGRVDIKYNTFEELENGKNFKILEINGILAEPTHIYDAENYNYFNALKAIRTHWKSLYQVATTNHKDYQVPYKSSKKFISEMFELRAYTKKIKSLSNEYQKT
jgi:hypothetical protein